MLAPTPYVLPTTIAPQSYALKALAGCTQLRLVNVGEVSATLKTLKP
jgi:hypothetical protein